MKAHLRLPLPSITLVCVLALAGCGPSSPSSGGMTAWRQAVSRTMDGLETVPSLGERTIPVLSAPALAKSWGAPTLEASPSGGYRISYKHPSKPFERLVIYGSPKPFPALATPPDLSYETMVNDELTALTKPQSFRSTSILGKPVRWFVESEGGGADGVYSTTEGFSLTAPDGRTGHYRIVIESVSNAAPARFREAGW